MKKFLLIAGIIFVIFLSALFMIPVFYDVNSKLRPVITKTIEDNLNAKADIGRLSLSLWGKVGIKISSISLTETLGLTKVFEVEGAELQIPFSSLFADKMNVTFAAKHPRINLISGKDGKLNAMKLMKNGSKASSEAKTEAKSDGTQIAGLGSKVYFSADISEAEVIYKDEKSGLTSKVKNLGLEIDDVGLNHPFAIKARALLDIKGLGASAAGPVEVTGTSEIKMKDQFENISLKASGDLDDLAVTYGTLFRKAPKTPLNLKLDVIAAADHVDLNSVQLVVNDLKVETSGKILLQPEMNFDLKVKTSKMALEHWKKIIALIGDFELTGQVSFDAAIRGTTAKFTYDGGLDLSGGSAKVPGLRVPATAMNLDLDFKTDHINVKKASMKLGGSDLGMTGTVDDFNSPRVRMNLKSALLNLDEILPESKPAAASGGAGGGEAAEGSGDVSFEGPIAKLKKNPIMRKLDFLGRAEAAKVVVHKAELSKFESDIEFKNLVLNLKKASLNAYGGAGDLNLVCDFSGPEATYKIGGNVSGVDMNSAMMSQFPELKDSLKGQAWAKMNLTGAGVKLGEVKKNLKGAGDFRIEKGSWSALSGMKLLAEKLDANPQIKEKIGSFVVGDKFKTANSNFSIKDSKMFIEKTEMDMEDSKTSIYMDGWIAFDKTLSLKGEIFAPAPNPPPKLKTADGRAKIPFEANGPMNSPQMNWDLTLKAVAGAYLEDEAGKALGKEIKKLKENTKDENIKKLLEQVPDDLLKGIKF